MISVFCSCGKQIFASEEMAGQDVQCFKCRRMVLLPGGSRQSAAVAIASDFAAPRQANLPPEDALPEKVEERPALPPGSRRVADALYWVLLLALLPLVSVLFHEKDPSPLQRLERTLQSNPELKPKVETLLNAEKATLEHLFAVLPNQRIDELAHLPRNTHQHVIYAIWAGVAFFVLIGVFMAHGFAPAWKLGLAAACTGTVGIACLFLFHDFIGLQSEVTLEREGGLAVNLVAFTLIVGLGEELSKALVVIFYLRTDKNPTWRGACFWGMASGIGFGISEAVSYAASKYNGVCPVDVYLTRYISCVALHAVWSASVGIALFNSRRLVSQVVSSILYLGDVDREALLWAIVQVLGVPMLLHGAYDALLTQEIVVPALLVAVVSFGWLGWQIETAREKEAKEQAERETPLQMEPAPATV